MAGIEIVKPGVHCTVQDLGRPGLAHLGVGMSGAADRRAAIRANETVGNQVGAAVLECVLGGLVVRARGALVVAVTGAPTPVRVTSTDGVGRDEQAGEPIGLADGDVIAIGRPTTGLRTYLAVRGGIDVPPVLGSRSTDVLAGIGPDPIRPRQLLPVGREVAGPPVVRHAEAPSAGRAGAAVGDARRLTVVPGPREESVTADSIADLYSQAWLVGSASNRVGLRLSGVRPLVRTGPDEIPSEGMVPGAIQVPPSGEPIVLLADHPVTGGYPVVGVLVTADLEAAAQLRPGDHVRFGRIG